MNPEITKYISELTFPAAKRDVLVLARIRNAPSAVMDVLTQIDNQIYRNMVELWHEIDELKERTPV